MTRTASKDDGLAFEELASNSQHCCFALGNIVLTRSLVPPDAEFLKEWIAVVSRHGKQHSEGLGLLVLIDAHAPPPAEPERAAIKNAYVTVRDVVRCGVQVVEGEGFAAAAKRSILMIINLATDIGYPIRVAGNVSEAAATLSKVLGNAMNNKVDAVALTRLAEIMRARLQV
jgi:hypothetical protein